MLSEQEAYGLEAESEAAREGELRGSFALILLYYD